MKTTFIRITWVVGLALLFLLPLILLLSSQLISQAEAQEGKAPQYIGAVTCAKTCHKTAKQGKQLSLWQESEHGKAYETLGTDAAKAIAKEKGIADPQKAPECLVCHTTAHGVDAKLLGAKFDPIEGVGCESCHGPGSLYKKRKVMKDQEASIANGLLIPDEKICAKCHNEKSPTYKPFIFEERVKKVVHPKPEKKG